MAGAAARQPEVRAAGSVGSELEAEEALSGTASITTAPAPSPKRTSVALSSQSRIFDSRSPPTISARLARPPATIPYPWASAYMKPVQPADRS